MALRQITRLPDASRSIIRSTTIITSLPQMISELVQNALDAGASHVDVGVDIEQWQCWVRDDGSGIDRTGMSILAKGGEEGRYGSSKAYNSDSLGVVSTFGFRGEALASAADLSCLEISSRTSKSRETWSVILKGGKMLYSGVAVRWRREKPGTTVYIRDAFYNLPVRRLSHPSPTRTLELVRKDLECAALVFPGIAFSLENSAKEKEEGNGRGRILTIPTTSSSLAAFRHLFGRALCEHAEEVDARLGEMRIQGFLSVQGAHSKAHQYLYLNRHLLSPCDLHRAIDTRFAASSFGRHALDEAGRARSARRGTRRSPRKNERRPVYVLDVTVPRSCIDNCLEPAKAAVHFENPEAVANFVSSVVQSFLIRHGFCSNSNKESTRKQSGSPRKRRKIVSDDGDSKSQSRTSTPVTDKQSLVQPQHRMQYTPMTADPPVDHGQKLQWTDQAAGRMYMIDAMTGNSYSLNAKTTERDRPDERQYSHGNQRTIVDTRWLRKTSDRCCAEGGAVPDWIEQALEGWKNPTFGLQEPGVPSLTSLSSFSRQSWLQSQLEPGRRNSKHFPVFDPNLAAGRTNNAIDVTKSFDKVQLKSVEVLGQVDNKFIACLIADVSACTRTLILVDQHAADERVRVERFLSVLCQGFLEHGTCGKIETREMQPAFPILLTRREARALSASEVYRQAFERWGFRFAQMAVSSEEQVGARDEYVQILVETVPEIVHEKLLLADELRELVKGFLAKLEAEDEACAAAPSCSPGIDWTTALRWCPRELLDLVNSKACRGAIMFNDRLDIEQCQKLISQLSDTVWPFICAHGRPSLVPLTNIDTEEGRQRTIDWNKFIYREH